MNTNYVEDFGSPILKPKERVAVIDAINKVLEEKHMNLDAIGYEDLYGMFNVYFTKKDNNKPLIQKAKEFRPLFYEGQLEDKQDER